MKVWRAAFFSLSLFCAQMTHRLPPSRHTLSHSSPLACVDESVFLHVGLLVEPLPAELARVGPCVGVDEQVRGQSGRPLEAFAADLAVEAPFLKRDARRGCV